MNKYQSKIEQRGDCKIWIGRIDDWGYGEIRKSVNGKKKNIKAHRYAWSQVNGEIPKGLFVCHKCDVPACVNVNHLFLGTHKENMRDMVLKKRARNQNGDKTHCKYGHPFKGENLYEYKLKDGRTMRQCLACRKQRESVRYEIPE